MQTARTVECLLMPSQPRRCRENELGRNPDLGVHRVRRLAQYLVDQVVPQIPHALVVMTLRRTASREEICVARVTSKTL